MKIIDDEEYEKNKTFTIVLEEPILLEVGQRHGELKTPHTTGSLTSHHFFIFYLNSCVSVLSILAYFHPSIFYIGLTLLRVVGNRVLLFNGHWERGPRSST